MGIADIERRTMEKDLKPVEEMTDEERRELLLPPCKEAMEKHFMFISKESDEEGYFLQRDQALIYGHAPVYYDVNEEPYLINGGGWFLEDTREEKDGKPSSRDMRLMYFRSKVAVSPVPEDTKEVEIRFIDEKTGEETVDTLVLVPFEPVPGKYITLSDAIVSFAVADEKDKARANLLLDAYFYPLKRTTRKEKRRYVKSADTSIPNTPMTKALFHPHSESYFMPADYWEDGKEISTGHGGSLFMSVRAPKNIDINAAPTSYVMTLREEYWHAKAYSLAAKSGLSKISGRDLLTSAGITNVYSDSAIKTMDEAYRSISKLMHTPIFFDATKEKQEGWRKDKPLTLTISESNIIAAKRLDITLTKEDTGDTLDFELVLADPADPASCFPVATFADERGYILEVDEKKLLPPRAKMDTRIMAFYVSERIAEKKSEPKLSFDTFFEDMGLTDSTPAEKKKCDRAQAALRGFFDNAKKEGLILRWRYYRKGGKISGISWERPEKSS